MSILNPPEGIALVIQRRLSAKDCKVGTDIQAENGRIWLDCSNVRSKGYTLNQKDQCLSHLQEIARLFPHYDYRVMSMVTYEPPRKAALKGF